ncbi:MAG: metallophosphoesterase family protein [Thiotrichales bacterium]|nr:MAG: metallophosphoesterase family protein [Thiotrichales bacterium]
MSWIKRFIKFVLFIVVAYAAGRTGVVFFGSQLTGERAPYLQMLTDDSVTVRWQTRGNRMGVLKYGQHPDHLNYTLLEDSVGKVHSITATNLQPNTRYYYSVGDISGYKDPEPKYDWFRTMPEGVTGKATRIWVIGDSGQPGEVSLAVRDAMMNWIEQNPRENNEYINLWLALGDIAYRSGTNEQFQAALFDTYPNILRNQALWPVYGNHDARRWTYFKLFTLPENGEAGGVPSGTENYYSIDYENIHLVILDSQDSSLKPDSDMLTWLKQDLAQNTKQWLIVAFHHPPYSKGSHNSDDKKDSNGRMVRVRENVLPILEAAAVDLVLSGHSHMYERSHLIDCHYGKSDEFSDNNVVSKGIHGQFREYRKPKENIAHSGAVYVVSGSSSKVDYGLQSHPAMVVSMEEAGSLLIDVEGNRLTTRFINDEGKVMDEFAIQKQNGITSNYTECIIKKEQRRQQDNQPESNQSI